MEIWKQNGDMFLLDEEALNNKIREIAYYKWESSGKPTGMDEDFWFQAELEVSQMVFT